MFSRRQSAVYMLLSPNGNKLKVSHSWETGKQLTPYLLTPWNRILLGKLYTGCPGYRYTKIYAYKSIK
jgi:hypothetical protein